MASPITFADVAHTAQRLSRNGPLMARTVQRWRPYFCPFDVLLNWVPPAARVLDVGCGSGLLLGLAAELTEMERGLGLDARESAIDLARQMLGDARPAVRERLEFRQLDIAGAWPADEEEFDVVSLIEVLHLIPPQAQGTLVEQAADKLAPGGILMVLSVDPRPGWQVLAHRLHERLVARQRTLYLRPFSAIAAWATRAQLKQIEHQRVDSSWYGHDLGIFQRPISRVINRPHRQLPTSTTQRRLGRRP
jgi:2-polyprenyl-3-methyl-5-hydroxy-6-metoxy-1,4-benzoquinol methylase